MLQKSSRRAIFLIWIFATCEYRTFETSGISCSLSSAHKLCSSQRVTAFGMRSTHACIIFPCVDLGRKKNLNFLRERVVLSAVCDVSEVEPHRQRACRLSSQPTGFVQELAYESCRWHSSAS